MHLSSPSRQRLRLIQDTPQSQGKIVTDFKADLAVIAGPLGVLAALPLGVWRDTESDLDPAIPHFGIFAFWRQTWFGLAECRGRQTKAVYTLFLKKPSSASDALFRHCLFASADPEESV